MPNFSQEVERYLEHDQAAVHVLKEVELTLRDVRVSVIKKND